MKCEGCGKDLWDAAAGEFRYASCHVSLTVGQTGHHVSGYACAGSTSCEQVVLGYLWQRALRLLKLGRTEAA